MNDYLSIRIDLSPCSPDATDLAAAFLADAGCESFEPDSCGLTAYLPAASLSGGNPEVIADDAVRLAKETLADFPFPCRISVKADYVEGKDWNEEWEKNYFKPILIDGRCVIHSTFHRDVPQADYDIIIDPKMAFGTGHHDTTSNMIRHILEIPLDGKDVIDMGTGTAILAILTKMRGAKNVSGIEIDRPAYENAIDNAALNNTEINLIHGDASALAGLPQAGLLMANINRNIILQDIDRYASALRRGGIMLLSGFYSTDVDMILNAASSHGLSLDKTLVSPNDWTALRLVKA